MSLLCFQGSSDKELNRLAPVWAPDAPERYELQIDSFDTEQLVQKGKVDSYYSETQRYNNFRGSQPVKYTFDFTEETSRSSTISLSQDSRWKVGGKVSFELSATEKAGVPFVEGDTTEKLGFECSVDHDWGSTTTDGSEKRTSATYKHSEEVTVPPGKGVAGRMKAARYTCRGVKWTGKVIACYPGGGKRMFDVSGEIDSATVSDFNAEMWDLEPPKAGI